MLLRDKKALSYSRFWNFQNDRNLFENGYEKGWEDAYQIAISQVLTLVLKTLHVGNPVQSVEVLKEELIKLRDADETYNGLGDNVNIMR